MSYPSLSLIVPVRNERDHIVLCIESIFAMQEIENAEVIVIDGLSDDGTREELELLEKHYSKLRVVDNPKGKVTSALNIGIAMAKGSIIIRLDAHALYATDYITQCLKVMEQTGAANVGGHMRAMPSNAGIVASAIAIAHYSPFGLGGGRFHDPTHEGFVETVWLGCYRREVFDKIGIFSDQLFRSEDIDINHRLRSAGFKIYLSPRIKAWYFCRPTIGTLFRQRFLDGVGVVDTVRFNPGAVRVRHLAPLTAVLAGIMVIIAVIIGLLIKNHIVFNVALLAMLSCTATWCASALWFSMVAFTQIKKTNAYIPHKGYSIRKRAVVLLPVVFMVLHFSYGIGSVFELIHLASKK